MNDIRLSPHFSLKEFECPCCKCVRLDEKLLAKLEALRVLWGKSIVITSGYRCERHNRKIGGARNSLHMKGKAVDIKVPEREQGKILTLCKLLGLRVIPYGRRNFAHIDIGGDKNGCLSGYIKSGISNSFKLLSFSQAGAGDERAKRSHLFFDSDNKGGVLESESKNRSGYL